MKKTGFLEMPAMIDSVFTVRIVVMTGIVITALTTIIWVKCTRLRRTSNTTVLTLQISASRILRIRVFL